MTRHAMNSVLITAMQVGFAWRCSKGGFDDFTFQAVFLNVGPLIVA